MSNNLDMEGKNLNKCEKVHQVCLAAGVAIECQKKPLFF